MKLLLLLASLAAASPRDVALDYMAAWNAHDSAKAALFLAEDVEYFDATTPEAQRGREAARRNIIQAFMTAAPDLAWTLEPGSEIAGGTGLAFRWTFTGTNTGAWADGTPATGKRFSIQGATLLRFRRGKIAYQGDFYDAHGLYKQLGLVP